MGLSQQLNKGKKQRGNNSCTHLKAEQKKEKEKEKYKFLSFGYPEKEEKDKGPS